MRRGIPLLDASKMRQRYNGEEACSSPPCQKRNDTTRRGIYPSSLCQNNKNATRRGIPLPDTLKLRQRHNGEGACPSPPCRKRNDTMRRGICPSLSRRNSKNATRRGITLPTASEDEKNERYIPYYWGWARRPFPCPRHPPHHAFSVVLFILWRTRVEGGGGGEGEGGEGGEGEGGWLAIAVELLPSSPLVTKWEITHVMGHGAGNPKPVLWVRVFWGYGIPNPYPYPREIRSKT